jgi:HAD superfamily hydrolase (TIGR01662 family)
MNRPIDLILLDLGNTLIYDSEPWPFLFAEADAELWRVLHHAGVDLAPSDVYGEFETLFSFYNFHHRGDLEEPTTAKVLRELLAQKGQVLAEKTLREGLRAMYSVTQSNWFPEPDALPMLRLLREGGFRLGLISNAADDENTQTLVDKGGFRQYLDYAISSAAYGKRKPHPGIFRAALDHFGTSPERAVMVGDTYDADIAGGHQVGMNTIWITRRLREPTGSRGLLADAVVSALSEIPEIVSG